MRINAENKTMDMEVRDINYIMPAYVRSYKFYNKNELPGKIIFPMFPSVNVPGTAGEIVAIPIEYVIPLDDIAVEIAKDGEAVAEVTPAQEKQIDDKDEEIKRLKEQLAELTPTGGGGDSRGGLHEAATAEREIPIPFAPAPEDLIRQEEEADPNLTEASPARAAFADEPTPEPTQRIPKQPPGGDIGAGQPLSNMEARDVRHEKLIAKDLQPDKEINESEEKPFEKEIKRDEAGKPIVEDKPDAVN